MRNFILIHVLLFLVVAVFSMTAWPYGLLSVAQLVFIPILLRLAYTDRDWFWKYYPYFAIPAYVAVMLEQLISTSWEGLLATIYLFFTLFVAIYGVTRFLHRGFTHLEEFAIEMGLIYLAMGGGWYFAFISGIDLGFSPLLTWLTAIHFHYSAFILPFFVGFLGRLHTSRLYRSSTVTLLAAPMVVAVGITFSRWIEVGAVLLYVYGLGGIIWIAWHLRFTSWVQKWLVRISFTALAVTISFSMLYVLSNGFGLFSVTIDFMLRFHGVLNCVVFALLGIIGWSLAVPTPRFRPLDFPVSRIRGRKVANEIGEVGKHRGLSDDMMAYGLELSTLSPQILDFYENTIEYRLRASVHWHHWFKPFAFLYSVISRRMQQINLPMRNEEVEMTGSIYTIHDGLDGRENVRAWERKVKEETIFTALYSQHHTNERLYMNIALPLPFTTMTGILELRATGKNLQLTSKRTEPASDAGVYLSIGSKELFKLPLQEDFFIEDEGNGFLQATHRMWIFSIPFLRINYVIDHY
ncbi:YndJ family protein [Sporosarcina obsidiansis]|uniref:YndJ family protein n=1 Tax=Sporosarcina obsidiansis TaxID=2660748 RepID=UPI001891A459|nr:YndJ family protein [Sporosarcina obsidiansis]